MIKSALPPLINPDSEILILGTMPGEKSIELQQYYGNRGNRFWKILFEVFETDFTTDYDQRKKLLHRNKIALWNVLQACERAGSQDLNIRNEVANDFDGFYRRYPNIKHVFFESKAAAKYYQRYGIFKDGVTYSTLPSTSGLNAGITHAQKLEQWQYLATVTAKKL